MPGAARPPTLTGMAVVFDALVLAGGRASRLGTPKPGLVVAGRPLLDHALSATTGAERTVVVGPPELSRPGLDVVREKPAYGGPVAGLDAGLRALANAPGPAHGPSAAWILVLACDVPRAAEAVPKLLAAAEKTPVDAVHLTRAGRAQWLVGVYRREALVAAIEAARGANGSVHGLPVRRVISQLACHAVDDPRGLSDDVDTWEDKKRLDEGETRPGVEEDQ